ncbi:hypothetical protein J7E70_33775 [Variovorax paradoxus]|nr:hypothetical protein [Variovorax paradoxus]MBT2305368.1 hypothetical protein [Variovorax paradoxus]
MKIFIAGATGALGLPLVRVLCALGHQVTGSAGLVNVHRIARDEQEASRSHLNAVHLAHARKSVPLM